jgi:hypothetical protein
VRIKAEMENLPSQNQRLTVHAVDKYMNEAGQHIKIQHHSSHNQLTDHESTLIESYLNWMKSEINT